MTRLIKAPALKFLLLVGAAATVLAACNRKEEEAAAPPPAIPAGPAGAAAPNHPLAYESKNSFANVKLTLPDAVKGQPELHKAVYDASVKDLQTFVEGAQADRTEAGGDGGMPPYERVIEYGTAVQTGKLFGLSGTSYEFTGGAHGNPAYLAVLWDKALKRRIDLNALLKPGADRGALERLLCAAVNAEKKVRDPQAETLTLGPPKDGAYWSCPALSETVVGLAPSTTPGKAGGLTFLIGPYVVGPYAEGGYEIDLPQSAIRALLNPAYADEFAGAPPKREG
jgi:hypothetical protein